MNRDHVPSIADPTSPWFALSEWRKPNLKWCEAQNNGWIIEPANAWSNVGFILAGLWIAQNNRKYKSRAILSYSWAMILMGLFSFIYHASYTFVFQILDFLGMYLTTYLMVLIQMKRLGWIKNAMAPRYFWGWVMATTLFTIGCDYFTDFPIQLIILVQSLFIVLSEAWIWKNKKVRYGMRFFWTGTVLMGIAMTFSALDAKRIFCDPNNHWLQGHALWHWFGSLGLTCVYLHHTQFDEQLI